MAHEVVPVNQPFQRLASNGKERHQEMDNSHAGYDYTDTALIGDDQ
jgi:hypothetical protein